VTALILYAILGPGLWALFALLMALAYGRMNRLKRPATAMAQSPSVAILIPAKDEGDGIRGCLQSVLAQDYPNFSIICINDRSTDNTGAIMDELAASTGGKVQVIHVPAGGLPPGWLGKCHALWTAAKNTTADWILFVDSDVTVATDALSCALALAVNREYDAVSIMTKLDCDGFLEHLVLPLAAASVSAMCAISLTNDDNRKPAFANGQFFLIKRSAYEAVGGHESVKDHITEDVALMRILKARGFRTRLYMGRKFASTRMHSTYRQMLHGWGRIYSGVSSRKPWRILGAILVVLNALSAWIMLPIALMLRQKELLALAGLHWLIATSAIAVFYHWSGNPKRYALLFPLAAGVLLSLYAYALKMCATGKVAWRGTSYTYDAAPAGSPKV
jgi:cellulose synthase/poly-beta-1,6-N-acetylglucosamine synthase-like glycosyltransferase